MSHGHVVARDTCDDAVSGRPVRIEGPHRHWAWGREHRHTHAAAAHGHAAHGPEHATDPSAPQPDGAEEHAHDSIGQADAYLTARPDRPVSAADMVGCPAVETAATLGVLRTPCRAWRVARPPGDRLPSLHDLLPHVLRV